jgi:cysteine synthase A
MNGNRIQILITTTDQEIWRQTGGRVDAFLSIVGGSGTYSGISVFSRK